MSISLITDAAGASQQVQEFWSPLFIDELLETAPLASLVNREYEGDIKKGGDTVHVSVINRTTAQRKTVGAGHESFNTQKLTTTRVSVIADQVITAALEFDDLVELQSQLGDPEGKSQIRAGLIEAIQINLNTFLYGLVAPSGSTPDHTITSVTDFNAAQLSANRKLASQAKWMKAKGWWALLDPSYYSDLLNAQTLTAVDESGSGDAPRIGGQFVNQRFGWNILEDNSDGILTLSGSSEDAALLFHPDFLLLAMQTQPEIKVSDLHPNKQHGFLISAKLVVGSKLGPSGDVKHITVIDS